MEAPSLTRYYGCMHAFASAFAGEVAMVRDLVGRLEGQRPLTAFGWQAALDRARGRATVVLDRWRRLNEALEGGVASDAFERRVFGGNPVTPETATRTARALTKTMEILNGRIDELRAYGGEDVRWISGLAEEMLGAIGPEARASGLVAGYLERGAPGDGKLPADGGDRLLASYYRAFSEARDEFRAGLDG
jgi:hypothetical protein